MLGGRKIQPSVARERSGQIATAKNISDSSLSRCIHALKRYGVIGFQLLATAMNLGAAEARITVVDDLTGQPLPARIHLVDQAGKPQRPPQLPFWHDHFVCAGNATVDLRNGSYNYTVERGPEFSMGTGKFEIHDGEPRPLTIRLKRIANLAEEGWFSGETHFHRGLKDIELLMRAEDLNVAQAITWWNKTNPWKETVPPEAIKRFEGNRYYHRISGEDERDGGALLFCDLERPLDITGGTEHFPSSLIYAKAARERGSKWIDAEKPFWWDFPMWLAHGIADTVGIAHNHMHRGGVLENEAWGRARDREKYPAPQGNAHWSQQIYYHALNCGLRLPPSAGSASGVLPNPVGYNRAYVHVEGELSYEKWRDGLLAGRSFVSNGPLLRCRANGNFPGHVFSSRGPVELTIEGRLDSRDPIKSVELVRNGVIEAITLPAQIRLDRSGWFLVRAIADVPNTFRFASTAPWYVEIADRPFVPSRESAQFFVDWCHERMGKLEKQAELSAAQREQVLEPWRVALRFWESKLIANQNAR
jgi:hypothetical protein